MGRRGLNRMVVGFTTTSNYAIRGEMNRSVVGSIYGRPSIKIAHFGSVNKHGRLSLLISGIICLNLLKNKIFKIKI
jgi:hypothetical protein